MNYLIITSYYDALTPSDMDSNPLLSSFQLMLLEHIIMCRLIMGNKAQALGEVNTCPFSTKYLAVCLLVCLFVSYLSLVV